MTHHVKATVVGPAFNTYVVDAKCELAHGFDAMTVVILEIANRFSMDAAEVLKAFTIVQMVVIRL